MFAEKGVREEIPDAIPYDLRDSFATLVGRGAGQKAYVADMGEVFSNAQGRTDARLRVIFDNGTENPAARRLAGRAVEIRALRKLKRETPVSPYVFTTERRAP